MFADRRDAGLQLARKLERYRNSNDLLVLALPRGGVVIGLEVARAAGALLDILIVRKIGFPFQEELAVGAVSETGVVILNQHIISDGGVTEKHIEDEISVQKREIERRIALYRDGRRLAELDGKKVILVDDGVATGATMKAAVSTLREERIDGLVIAVPVCPRETAEELRTMADEFVCLLIPPDFTAVGNYYRNFTQVTDEEVSEVLKEAAFLMDDGRSD